MKLPAWPPDTIARRFATTEILAVAVTLALVLLFNTFGGVWSQEPIERSKLLNEVSGLVRTVEAAPPEMRDTLSAAATSKAYRVNWYAATSPVATSLDSTKREQDSVVNTRRAVKKILADDTRPFVVVERGNLAAMPPGLIYDRSKSTLPYVLAVRLADRSWLVFTTMDRSWGLPQTGRWAIRLIFLALAVTLVTAIAARQFSKPVRELAEAVRQFGLNPRSPPIVETGPRELKQVARTFNAMQAQIQKFVAYRTMMLAAISHDLRTPLTRMRLRGEFIEDPDQQARLFRDVDEMQTMIDGALAFFRDDAIAEETTSIDLPHVLLNIANDYADQGIGIGYTGPAHAVYRGRPFALKRAFSNLVENAIKYGTPPEIEMSEEGNTIVVAVRDRGPGVPPDALTNVFRPYYRVDKSRNRTTGGVGLGLTVAQAIVHGHGGQITLNNRSGGGLEVRIVLPAAAQADESA
jgi:signal transduction histidine kinase